MPNIAKVTFASLGKISWEKLAGIPQIRNFSGPLQDIIPAYAEWKKTVEDDLARKSRILRESGAIFGSQSFVLVIEKEDLFYAEAIFKKKVPNRISRLYVTYFIKIESSY